MLEVVSPHLFDRRTLAYILCFIVSLTAAVAFWRGSLTGAPPLYSKGVVERGLHFVAGILFAAIAIYAAVSLFRR
ncbi:MAG TPA: hypothetical protein VGL89_18450 [Candidatus Koribacter sp.]|jgi:hypothetical protein